ncbi:MAG TPA: hypothetical protein VK513_16575, partial [Terriglobales bacterium]|nr:hypothetical protein [Terriglobales bacterium]
GCGNENEASSSIHSGTSYHGEQKANDENEGDFPCFSGWRGPLQICLERDLPEDTIERLHRAKRPPATKNHRVVF